MNYFHNIQTKPDKVEIDVNEGFYEAIHKSNEEKLKKETIRFHLSLWIPVVSGLLGVFLGFFLSENSNNKPQIQEKEKQLLLRIFDKLDSVYAVNNQILLQMDTTSLQLETKKDKKLLN